MRSTTLLNANRLKELATVNATGERIAGRFWGPVDVLADVRGSVLDLYDAFRWFNASSFVFVRFERDYAPNQAEQALARPLRNTAKEPR